MNLQTFRSAVTACVLGVMFSSSAALASKTNDSSVEQHLNFTVSLDNKRIGYHKYSLKTDGNQQAITSEARFDVKVLFVTAFRYRHSSQETWQQNCIKDINATTTSNGRQQTLRGTNTGGNFQLTSALGPEQLNGCVQSFAYWNPQILEADALLNTQTGEHVAVDVTSLGTETLTLDDGAYLARKYSLRSTDDYTGEPVDITLWYAASNMQWLALESMAKGQRRLRYILNDAGKSVGAPAIASVSGD